MVQTSSASQESDGIRSDGTVVRTAEATSSGSRTVTVVEEVVQPPPEALVLHLGQARTGPRVAWATDTVDNEGMGKRKSKCCCIYKKPRAWDESSSDSDSDCETGNCRGHVEKKHRDHDHDHHDDPGQGQPPPSGAKA